MIKLLAIIALAVSPITLARASERHALLIGIGAYQHAKVLHGPPNDVAALRNLLIDKFKYNPRFVHTLVDQQATKAAIMQAMQSLVDEVKPGDYVIFYYSGHGTSTYGTRSSLKTMIPEDTGASLTVEFDQTSVETFLKTVIQGRELRPYFTELDAKAQVLAIYDSCYSQNAMKSISITPPGGPPANVPKYVPLGPQITGTSKSEIDDIEAGANSAPAENSDPVLPYQHLVAISAAMRNQPAIDVSDTNATLDGKPHGQLTNALLIGLQGPADRNHDGKITTQELYDYVNQVAAGGWTHNPKLILSANSSAALQQPAFDGKQIVLSTTCQQEAARQPRVSAPADILRELGNGFISVTQGWDIKAVAQGQQYLLYNAGGVQLNDAPMSRRKAMARLQAEQDLEQISEVKYCKQSFNTELYVSPGGIGIYTNGMKPQFFAKVDRSAYLLVLDIDQEGGLTVEYAGRLIAGQKTPLTDERITVTDPYGVDLIKAFAFENKPDGFDRFVLTGKEIYLHPGDAAYEQLMAMVKIDDKGRSEAKIQITTRKELRLESTQ